MAYQEKYNYTFIPTGLAEVHLVEIWQDTVDVLVAEEVTAGLPPFSVELPSIDKFQTVRGTGCIINLLSATDMKFFDGLYHVDPKEFLIKHYIDGVLNWTGYLNPEMYREPYDQSENYIIQTTGNDGFNLMDRLFFNESDSSNFTGMKSEWEIIQIVLDKIGLSYNDIRISLSTTFSDFTGAAYSTIIHESFIDSANFYDEDNKPMTLREVIESILTPYGAFIVQSNGSVYITDINTIAAGGSVTYQTFNSTTYAYIIDNIEVNEKTVTSIEYLGTGQPIDISGGKNRQLVTYSPYPSKIITQDLIVRPEEFTTVPASFSTKDGYFFKTLGGHVFYDNPSTGGFEESKQSAQSTESFVYFRYPTALSTSIDVLLQFKDTIFINIGSARSSDVTSISGRGRRYFDGASILVTGSVLAKTKDNPYTGYSQAEIDADADKVTQLQINILSVIGDKYYSRATDTWTTNFNTNAFLSVRSESGETIGNKWVDFSFLMRVASPDGEILVNGDFDFWILNQTKTRIIGGDLEVNSAILQDVWIRNLSISVVNNDGSEISDKDFEYIGELDKTFKEEGKDIRLTTGTSSLFSDRGKICWNDGTDYHPITEWTRAGQTFKIEELLLGSLSSNFRAGYITLTNMNLKNSFGITNVITDTNTGARKLMVKAFLRDYYNNTTNTEVVEITEDELTIVKE